MLEVALQEIPLSRKGDKDHVIEIHICKKEIRELGNAAGKNLFGGGGMMHGVGIRHPNKAIVLFFFIAFAAMAVFAVQSEAYSRYNDGCQNCHGAFTGGTSPKGTVFPSNNKHEMHRASTAMGTA